MILKPFYNPPSLIKLMFKNFIWNSFSEKIVLTFDDGPNPDTTEIILQSLAMHKIKGIFFCVGNNIDKYESLTQEILSEGHEIGNHMWNHSVITKMDWNSVEQEINKTNSLLQNKFSYKCTYFRPPHGRFNLKFYREYSRKTRIVMWSLLTFDYKNDFNIVKFGVQKYIRNNSIVVMHDSIKSKKIISDSINYLVEQVMKNNFSFGVPKSCLR